MRLINKFLNGNKSLNPYILQNPYYPKSDLSGIALLNEMTKLGDQYYDYRRAVSDSIFKANEWQWLQLKDKLLKKSLLPTVLLPVRRIKLLLDSPITNHGPEIFDPTNQ